MLGSCVVQLRKQETDDRQLCEVGVAGRVVERQAVLYGGAWRIPFAALISRNNRALSLPVRLCVVVLRLWVRLLVCRRFLAHTLKNFSGVAYFVTAPTTRLTTAHLIMKCIQIRIVYVASGLTPSACFRGVGKLDVTSFLWNLDNFSHYFLCEDEIDCYLFGGCLVG